MINAGEAAPPGGWSPSTKLFAWRSTAAFAAWTVVQPVLDERLLQESRLVGVLQWITGISVIFAVVLLVRYRAAATYRLTLSEAGAENPDSLVYGIRLDPVTMPVGKEWGDSRLITWGILQASAAGIDISRPSGAIMLQRPWSEIEFTARGIDVGSGAHVEEWWFRFIGDTGLFAWPALTRQQDLCFEKMASLRPLAA